MAARDLSQDPLGLSPEAMREIGYRTVDLLVDQLSDPTHPAMRRGVGEDLRRRLMAPPPEEPGDWGQLLDQLERDVLTPMSRFAHPGYFAFIPACCTFPGALGDLIGAALDIDAGSWMGAAGPSQVELVVLDWFKSWIGYPPEAAGILVSGGSAANMTALACAREALVGAGADRAVAYVADQTHSSIARAARLVGFRPDQLRVLPTDDAHRLRLDALVGAIEADVKQGLRPLIVAANAGATNTGAIDPLEALAEVAHDRGMWLHVDGAYGGFAALSERGRHELAGIELADSVTLDPHKWLYQPIECGCLLVREGHLLRQAFTINPDYLVDYKGSEVNFSDLGLQLTRAPRALKIWLSINYFGLGAFRRAIDRAMDLARAAERQVLESPELELVSPASLGIICFRRRFDGVEDEETASQLNAQLVREFEATGIGLVSSTRLHGTYAIRLCVMNHTSGPGDVEAALSWFASAPVPAAAREVSPTAYEDPRASLKGGWGDVTVVAPEVLRELPLLHGLGEGVLEVVARSARDMRADAGETIVGRWHGTRQLYVILSGEVEVRNDQGVLRTLGAGDYFGEIAALDWGAGFGYARTASVVATSPVHLLVLAPSLVWELVKQEPELERRLRATARERLRQV